MLLAPFNYNLNYNINWRYIMKTLNINNANALVLLFLFTAIIGYVVGRAFFHLPSPGISNAIAFTLSRRLKKQQVGVLRAWNCYQECGPFREIGIIRNPGLIPSE